MEQLENFIASLKDLVWGIPLLLFLVGTGIYLTYILRGMQFRYLGYAFRQVLAKQKTDSQGDISHFQALMTSLAGAIGTGTIVGVATSITIGGLGSLFWMWVIALLSMATKYAETLLAVKYRTQDKRGEMSGGPMQYMALGLGWKKMAIVFALLGSIAAIGTGNLVQVNSIAGALENVWELNPWVTGIVTALLTGVVLLGGVKSIGRVASVMVPLMAILYIGGGLIIIGMHIDRLPEAFSLIISSAFQGQAAIGGFAGSTIMAAVQMGVARSVFSNEAGLGISTMAAAAAKTDSPGRQAMITMTGALISTVIVCSVTGLVLAVTGALGKTDANGAMINGASMAIQAFSASLVGGKYIVTIGLILFAYTTVIAWAYYGEKCFEYLLGERAIPYYRLLFTLLVIPGAAINMSMAWDIADITNGLMVIPNLFAVIALSKVVLSETALFLKIADSENALEQLA